MQASTDLPSQTHDFCYTYARATKGVSYCAPAYYADRLCDRGRCYLHHLLSDTLTLPPGQQFYPNRGNPATQTGLQYFDVIKDFVRDHGYYRKVVRTTPASQQPPRKYGFTRRNPWHENLDNIMFYL